MTHIADIAEQRRYERYSFDFGARFIADDVMGENARLINVSEGGAALRHIKRPRIGSSAIVYIENMDRFEGEVVRVFRRGFALQFKMSSRKRRRLAESISALAGQEGVSYRTERRAFRRVLGAGEAVQCKLDNGEKIEGRIIDCSIANATLRSDARPFLGTKLHIGQTRAKVVRHTKDGFAVEFSDYWQARPLADSYYIYH